MHITWAQLFTSITGEKRNKEISQSIYSFLCDRIQVTTFSSLYVSKFYKLCTICSCYFNEKTQSKRELISPFKQILKMFSLHLRRWKTNGKFMNKNA